MGQPLMGAVGVDTDRAERTVVAIRSFLLPHLAEVASVVRAMARSAALDDEAFAASRSVDVAVEMVTEIAGFMSSQTSGALFADAVSIDEESPGRPVGVTLEGVAVYLDQYLQTGSAHLFDDDIGPNAVFAREVFADAVANNVLVEREGWLQPASCGDDCHSPYSNPAWRELLGIENMVERRQCRLGSTRYG